MPTFTKKQKAIGLFTGLLFLVWLHFILYHFYQVSADYGRHNYWDEGFVVSAYATGMLATGGELGLVIFKNLLVRIACFLLLIPYIFVVGLIAAIASHGWSNPSVPYTGTAVSSGYHDYLMVFPFAISILLFFGLIHIIGSIWPFLSNE